MSVVLAGCLESLAGTAGRTIRPALRAWLFPVVVLLAVGCGERASFTGTAGAVRNGTGTATSGTSSAGLDPRLVGHWSRTVLLQDNTGAVHASRTSWRFGSDALATRAVVASNLTFGFVDSLVTRARWRVDGGQVVISYLPAGSGDARFDYRFQGATLILGGIPFDRQ